MVAKAERAEALLAGLAYYFTGRPCRRGHVSKRRTSNGMCHRCLLDDKRARYSQKLGYRTRAEITAETHAATRVCPKCERVFPNTKEFFVLLRKVQPSGTVTIYLSRECRKCRGARFKPFYYANQEREIA